MANYYNQNYDDYSNNGYSPVTEEGPFSSGYDQAYDENQVLGKVFTKMGIGLGISAIAAMASYYFLGELMFLAYLPLIIIELILVIVFSLKLQSMSVPAANGCFIAYALINGLTLSSIFYVYEIGSIFTTFFIAAAMFGGAALYGKVTNKNLAGMGTYLMMGLFGIIIAGIVNIFIQNSMLDFIITIIGIVIFIGLTAYDVNKIRGFANAYAGEGDFMEKLVIHSALALYLDFINIFLKILSFFGKRKR